MRTLNTQRNKSKVCIVLLSLQSINRTVHILSLAVQRKDEALRHAYKVADDDSQQELLLLRGKEKNTVQE